MITTQFAIAVGLGFNAEGGTRNFRFDTRASHSSLADYLTIGKGLRRPKDGFFLRAESFFNVATEIERLDSEGVGARVIDSYGGRSLHEQSHGESFMALMLNRFGGNGVAQVDYRDTEHYQVMHDFMANPERMLRVLLEPDEKADD